MADRFRAIVGCHLPTESGAIHHDRVQFDGEAFRALLVARSGIHMLALTITQYEGILRARLDRLKNRWDAVALSEFFLARQKKLYKKLIQL
jgi:hypothetical protein